jgi:hypothetical protein
MNKVALLLLGPFILANSTGLKANPLINFPAGDTVCSVTVTSHLIGFSHTPANVNTEGSPVVLQSVEITRIGKLQRDEMTWSDGKKTEAWTLLDLGLTLAEKVVSSSSFIYELLKGSPFRNAFCPTLLDLDEASVTWINPQSFTGNTDLEGKPTLHYQTKMSLPAPNGPPRNVIYQAWIDAKTLKPLALDDGDALYALTFSVSPASTGPLILPDRFKKNLQEYENANAKIRHL